jgi:enoyl-CoA hydratase/carnithine racemase
VAIDIGGQRVELETLLVEHEDHIVWITLNRPERLNAISIQLARELTEVMNQVSADDNARIVVIRGAGRAFGAGADLKEQKDFDGDPARGRALIDNWRRMLASIDTSPKVSIAAVHGLALAGSMELMMTCDMAVATDDARISDQHANYGLPPVGSATQRLPRLVGARKAKELLMTGDSITGKEAERLGLVNRSVPADEFDVAVREFALKLASKSPLITRMIKEMVNWGMQADFNTGMMLEKWAGYAAASYEDVNEGIAAFAERREPQYKGR